MVVSSISMGIARVVVTQEKVRCNSSGSSSSSSSSNFNQGQQQRPCLTVYVLCLKMYVPFLFVELICGWCPAEEDSGGMLRLPWQQEGPL
jgi:hypothetical protein